MTWTGWCHTSALLKLYYEILVLTHFLNNCIHMFYLSINKTGFDAKMQQWRQVLVLKMKMESFHIFLCSTHYLNVFNKVVLQIVHKFLAGERVFHLLSHFWVGNKDGQHFRHMRKDTCKCNKVVKKSLKKVCSEHTNPDLWAEWGPSSKIRSRDTPRPRPCSQGCVNAGRALETR